MTNLSLPKTGHVCCRWKIPRNERLDVRFSVCLYAMVIQHILSPFLFSKHKLDWTFSKWFYLEYVENSSTCTASDAILPFQIPSPEHKKTELGDEFMEDSVLSFQRVRVVQDECVVEIEWVRGSFSKQREIVCFIACVFSCLLSLRADIHTVTWAALCSKSIGIYICWCHSQGL